MNCLRQGFTCCTVLMFGLRFPVMQFLRRQSPTCQVRTGSHHQLFSQLGLSFVCIFSFAPPANARCPSHCSQSFFAFRSQPLFVSVRLLQGVEELLVLAPEGVHRLVLDQLGQHLLQISSDHDQGLLHLCLSKRNKRNLELLLNCLKLVIAFVGRHREALCRPG